MRKWLQSEHYNLHLNNIQLLVVFLVLFAGINLYLGQLKILNAPPQGMHLWRQADELSMTSNYYKNGSHFFTPTTYNLQSIDGHAALEFPIANVLTAYLYKIFGPYTLISRLITLIFVTFGFYSFFRLLLLLVHDTLQSLALTLIFYA
jgi:hypothetical protein